MLVTSVLLSVIVPPELRVPAFLGLNSEHLGELSVDVPGLLLSSLQEMHLVTCSSSLKSGIKYGPHVDAIIMILRDL